MITFYLMLRYIPLTLVIHTFVAVTADWVELVISVVMLTCVAVTADWVERVISVVMLTCVAVTADWVERVISVPHNVIQSGLLQSSQTVISKEY